MTSAIETRLAELGIELPEPQLPTVAKILPAMIVERTLYVSGQVTTWNGDLRYIGKVGREFDLEEGRAAARLSALNVLAQAKLALDGDLDRVARVVNLRGFVNAMPDFTDIPAVVNGASELMIDLFGDAGRHTRTAVGVAVMPFDVAIEVEAIFSID
ncbi:MAG: RidA family protein [Alphaproteobacteria bacterium]|nr:RidA family protein [Alphaproteobacteria bacterium]